MWHNIVHLLLVLGLIHIAGGDGEIGVSDSHTGIYQMKRIRCDWEGDGNLNRPPWAQTMTTKTVERNAAKESEGGTLDNSQLSAEAIVVPMKPQCRPESSKPWNGFPTNGNTGLSRGHIIPTDLGGINTRANVVPRDPKWQAEGGGWAAMTEVISKFVLGVYGWGKAPADYEVYELNEKDGWGASEEYPTPEVKIKMTVDLNPSFSDTFNKDNNLNENGEPNNYGIRLEPEPLEGNECLKRRIDIYNGELPEMFRWVNGNWESITGGLGDPYDNDQEGDNSMTESQLASVIAQGMVNHGFLDNYETFDPYGQLYFPKRRALAYGKKKKKSDSKFCGSAGKECRCADVEDKDKHGGSKCKSVIDGKPWCYVKKGMCSDAQPSKSFATHEWSHSACMAPGPKQKKPATPGPQKPGAQKKKKVAKKGCVCDGKKDPQGHGGPVCTSVFDGHPWCYVQKGQCPDGVASKSVKSHDWSHEACAKSKVEHNIEKKKKEKPKGASCECKGVKDKSGQGGKDCKSVYEEKKWCYVEKGKCTDGLASKAMPAYMISKAACLKEKQKVAAAKTTCLCDGFKDHTGQGGKDCKSTWEEKEWCFVKQKACKDGQRTESSRVHEKSFEACVNTKAQAELKKKKPNKKKAAEKKKAEAAKKKKKAEKKKALKKKKAKKKKEGECICDGVTDSEGNGSEDCDSVFDSHPWCYVPKDSCEDGVSSKTLKTHDWSHEACAVEDDDDETKVSGQSRGSSIHPHTPMLVASVFFTTLLCGVLFSNRKYDEVYESLLPGP